MTPAGVLARGEQTLACPKGDIAPFLAIFNSGIAYLWWKAWGDGFHVKSSTYAALPDLRSIGGDRLASLGEQLRNKLEIAERDMRQSGTSGGRETENVNLWRTAPDVLASIDDLILDGLGLQGEEYRAALAAERSSNILAYVA